MVCPKCGFVNKKETDRCASCGCCLQQPAAFVWGELPPMPVFHTLSGEAQEEEDPVGKRHRLRKRTRHLLWQVGLFTLEACVLAGVIGSIWVWKERQQPPPQTTDHIVYASEDIVRMLVAQKEQWVLEQPETGYNACCFLDLDFDGSPELISISYDSETSVTKLCAFRVRNCVLEPIPTDSDEEGAAMECLDVTQQLSLYYAPETREMLYLSADVQTMDDGEIVTEMGSFYLQENRIVQTYYFQSIVSADGDSRYGQYDADQTLTAITRQEYQTAQQQMVDALVNLHVQYEWVCSKEDLVQMSDQKLAALLLRSYDSFSYDTSGLALQ